MSDQKTYWKGTEQLTNDPSFVKNAEKEFPEYLPINDKKESNGGSPSRRDFLKMMGFGVAAASLAACEAPVRKAIPYLNKPVDVDPGIANYYASTYSVGGDYASIVVKTREGRPIKIEGNKNSSITQGGVNAQVEASVLSLYDQERLRGPLKEGKNADWKTIDKEITEQLQAISDAGGQIRIVSNTVNSPSTLKAIQEMADKYGNTEHVMYDAISQHGMLMANETMFGIKAVPAYDFSKANTIVSFGADFLGTWVSPIEHTKQYSKTRKVNSENKNMSRHYQFEANLSLTGSNADYRTPVKPSQEGLAVAALYNEVAKMTGNSPINTNKVEIANISKAAKDLVSNKGKSLVVAGSNDTDIQILVNGINSMLNNYGTTVDLNHYSNARKGDDASFSKFVNEAKSGNIKAVIFYNANPVYDSGMGEELKAALGKVSLTVSTSDRKDETADVVKYVAPDHHFLESWNDAEPKKGQLSLTQPTISPLFKTRQAQDSFMTWSGNKQEYYNFLRKNWEDNHFSGQEPTFDIFWDKTLHNGVFTYEVENSDLTVQNVDLSACANRINKNYKPANNGLEVVFYQKVSIGNGYHANNPWLQELPDPISKATWDNYATISQKMANDLGIKIFEGKTSKINLTINGQAMEVPALVQPGQANGTIGLALGYGRKMAGKVANGVGFDVYPFLSQLNGTKSYAITSGISVDGTAGSYQLAQTQTHQTFMGRETVIQEALLEDYKKKGWERDFQPHIETSKGKVKPSKLTLWNGHKYNNHHWGLAIDLNSCTGCAACTIACQSENNIPVVGKEEVVMRRDMQWMRVDRYYSSDAAPDDTAGLEKAAENPEVTFQPMMCQHCNNAPCETVCPVAATTHSTEGLNQMTYNRCVGTRYCANNCPYKVRRFNWFKYHDNTKFDKNSSMNNDLGKMVLNPDVTVRSRGVMEKCSMCVQRIQAGKLKAKKEKRQLEDKDVNTACASACPSDAIVFGDLNNQDSAISKYLKLKERTDEPIKEVNEERAYHVLEELRVAPNVWYMTKIRNKDKVNTKA
ncbi:quinol:cytochrome C oxidoreductase [Marivirga tractuosa]|uniref:Quinol:cytochrome c oxidoreductase iron-sulfur protein n=1 Tax=Marivirga tractuosa (strain ATCC 23168 / DSM 4126 / NBRC 15989 / NCIMB 1408 / VKM B-1430 / H-43) TaxID=643867 RepID=E4TQG1_MARTH|nr:TAT-variant-translocated molybdopterin oxidoreductase [Marivirga tractuosa]ADR23654.1 quinol:cytochrome c oxidoreductase iron-sulfur protein precursor [Marivirga tractuosa DSM 4126]BDD15665.1 quinol:cytochrome C oxidoreductase [Marivirga tractuosa]